MIKRTLLVFVILLLTAALSAEKYYWDREDTVLQGKMGKFEVLPSRDSVILVYADNSAYSTASPYFTIRFMIKTGNSDFKQIGFTIDKAFSSNDFCVDYSTYFSENGNLFVIYRDDQRRILLKKITNIETSPVETIIKSFSDENKLFYLPRIFPGKNNTMNILFYTYGESEKVHFYNIKESGEINVESFIGSGLLGLLNPELSYNGDAIYIIYQAKSQEDNDTKIYYKIFIEYSTDGGKTWSSKMAINTTGKGQHNQKPVMFIENNRCHIAWEKEDEGFVSKIYYKMIDLTTWEDKYEQMLSYPQSEAHSPKIYLHKNLINIYWFDNKTGSYQNYYRQIYNGESTEISEMARVRGRTMLNFPFIYKDKPYIIWNSQDADKNFFYSQHTDEFAAKPIIYINGLEQHGKTNKTEVSVEWKTPDDISGIKENRILVTRNPDERINTSLIGITPFIKERSYKDLTDGTYYVKMRSYDNAGNVSEEAVATFEVDTVPPPAPEFDLAGVQDDGTLSTNSPDIRWNARIGEEDLAKYVYYYKFFPTENPEGRQAVDEYENFIKSRVAPAASTEAPELKLSDLDNGILAIGIAGYDKAGNRSEINWNKFILNDYVVTTSIRSVSLENRGFSDKLLRITGRGFNAAGNIDGIIIDRDMKAPYDFKLSRKDFEISNDRLILQKTATKIDEGTFYVGLNHPERGLKFFKEPVNYKTSWLFYSDESGSIFSGTFKVMGHQINATVIVFTVSIMIWLLIIFLITRQLAMLGYERIYVKNLLKEYNSIKDQISRNFYEKQKEVIMKIKLGLTLKYTLLILSLVIIIVTSTAITVGAFALTSGTRNLTDEIKKRFSLVLVNFQQGMQSNIYLNVPEYEFATVPKNISSLPNVGFVFTRIKKASGDDTFIYFKGKNEDVIYNNIDTKALSNAGIDAQRSEITENIYNKHLNAIINSYNNKEIPEIISETEFKSDILDRMENLKTARLSVKSIQNDKERLDEIRKTFDNYKSSIDSVYIQNSKTKNYELKKGNNGLNKEVFDILLEIGFVSSKIVILPEIKYNDLKNAYLFYLPLYVIDETSGKFTYRGDVGICYSFRETIKSLGSQRDTLILMVLSVTLIAILLSAIGSVLLATSTIRPIKKMYKHVSVISKTDDYETLVGSENESLTINTGDEIAVLASAINDMTNKLIEKAKADKQLLLGKEIQKKFIPLEPYTTEHIDLYGFYEGAKGVSGDYFDYKKLDDDHYAFIMCDVAGKAVPAALIMVQISTVFHTFFYDFKPGKSKLETVSVVNKINDQIAEKGFQGRFAAILVMILNVKTGEALLTNAGYTQLLVYRQRLGKCVWEKLNPDSGAAGVLEAWMLPNPYIQERLKFDKGDIIFLFSDGIEESRNGKTFINSSGEEQFEEFSLERVENVINASKVKTPEAVIRELIEAEGKFRGDIEQYDDLTILGIMRK